MNPTTKTMAAGGLSAALVIVIMKELSRVGVTVDPDEAAALGTVLASVLHYAARWLPQSDPGQAATPAAPTAPVSATPSQ